MMLSTVYFGNTVQSYIIAIAILLLFVGAGKLFSALIVGIIKKFASRTKTTFDDIMINILEKPAVFALFIIGFYYASTYINLGARGHEILSNIITVLVVMNAVWVVNRILDAVMDNYASNLNGKKNGSILDNQLVPFMRKFLKVVVVLIGALFLIRNMGYDITSLVAGLGIGGLAFALAAQPLLSNLFGGLAILADKPFKIGDRIIIDQKYEGVVEEIGMRSTSIKTPMGTAVRIPNNLIATTAVENLNSRIENGVRFKFTLALEYSTSAEKIQEALDIVMDILQKNPDIIKSADAMPGASFWEFADSSLNIYGSYSIASDKIGVARTAVNLEIKKRFEKAHIKFAYPTQTLYLKKEGEHEKHVHHK